MYLMCLTSLLISLIWILCCSTLWRFRIRFRCSSETLSQTKPDLRPGRSEWEAQSLYGLRETLSVTVIVLQLNSGWEQIQANKRILHLEVAILWKKNFKISLWVNEVSIVVFSAVFSCCSSVWLLHYWTTATCLLSQSCKNLVSPVLR